MRGRWRQNRSTTVCDPKLSDGPASSRKGASKNNRRTRRKEARLGISRLFAELPPTR
jgi:hypothetical protein